MQIPLFGDATTEEFCRATGKLRHLAPNACIRVSQSVASLNRIKESVDELREIVLKNVMVPRNLAHSIGTTTLLEPLRAAFGCVIWKSVCSSPIFIIPCAASKFSALQLMREWANRKEILWKTHFPRLMRWTCHFRTRFWLLRWLFVSLSRTRTLRPCRVLVAGNNATTFSDNWWWREQRPLPGVCTVYTCCFPLVAGCFSGHVGR